MVNVVTCDAVNVVTCDAVNVLTCDSVITQRDFNLKLDAFSDILKDIVVHVT